MIKFLNILEIKNFPGGKLILRPTGDEDEYYLQFPDGFLDKNFSGLLGEKGFITGINIVDDIDQRIFDNFKKKLTKFGIPFEEKQNRHQRFSIIIPEKNTIVKND